MDINKNIPIRLSSGVKNIGAGSDTFLHVKNGTSPFYSNKG